MTTFVTVSGHCSKCGCGTGVTCIYVLYAIVSGGRFCICNIVRWTVLHMQSCPPGRCCCIMQLCLPGHICICSCVHPVHNRPCSKLNVLGRRKTFAIFFYNLSAWEMFGRRWVFAAIITWIFMLGCMHARLRAHILYMYSHVHVHRTVFA